LENRFEINRFKRVVFRKKRFKGKSNRSRGRTPMWQIDADPKSSFLMFGVQRCG
jgi:hypothetical protein